MVSDQKVLETSVESLSGRKMARLSLWFLVGVPVGIVFLTFWANFVKTSPTLNAEDRIRGWSTVVRELPATLFLIAVVVIGMTLAVHATRLGAVRSGLRAITWHGAALFFVLLIIMSGSAENIMTTRPATVKWLLMPVQLGISLGSVYFARQYVMRRQMRDNPS